jgi:hypothetical protein
MPLNVCHYVSFLQILCFDDQHVPFPVRKKTFPRHQMLSDLIQVIKAYPSLGKDASSALVAIGESIATNATSAEIDIVVKGTLSSESYVRNSALQCLQTLDLTDLDWVAELWIARNDADQQNARMARHIFEENALDVPEMFFKDLKPFLSASLMRVYRSL